MKKLYATLLSIIAFAVLSRSYAQAPDISYTTPQTYAVNVPITPLTPTNIGGAVPATAAYAQVSTFAGSGSVGAANGTSMAASFNAPSGITIDAQGNIYVSEIGNNLIRKITSSGMVSTLAGGGSGYGNGTGAAAGFSEPWGLVCDAAGNIYAAERTVPRIRKITPAGVVTTVAGSGQNGYVNGTGTAASFNGVEGITIDSQGNLYVADQDNDVIREITQAGIVTTFAGNGQLGSGNGTTTTASFYAPTSVIQDTQGNLYVASDNLIRKITPAGVVSTYAGDGSQGSNNGPAATANFNHPTGLTIDSQNNIYACDGLLIREISNLGIVSTLAGNATHGAINGIGTAASFFSPNNLINDQSGNLYITDLHNNLIRKISLTGYSISPTLPAGLVFDGTKGVISGTPTVTSPATNYTITAYNATGSSTTTVNIAVVLSVSSPNISYQTPQVYTTNTAITPLTPTNTGGTVPATIYGQVTTYAGITTPGSTNGQAANASFRSPTRLCIDVANNFYIADRDNNLIRKISAAGAVTTFASGFNLPNGVTITPSGYIYVADTDNNLIRQISPTGIVTVFAGSGSAGAANGTGTAATFYDPFGITSDASGNLYVADTYNNMIRKITPAGVVTTVAGSGAAGSANGTGTAASFNNPNCVAVDATGNLYVTDPNNNLIRKINTAGVVTTFAGTGASGSADGPATNATFNHPGGVCVDKAGNIFEADLSNNEIRKIDPAGMVTTVAGSTTLGAVNGTGTAASFYHPNDVQINNVGELYVTDYGNNLIRKVIVTGYTIDKTLPAGLAFDPTTGIISGTPAVTSPSTTYTITAYNTTGSSTTTVNITVGNLIAQTITFPAIANKTYGTADFAPGATASSGLPVTYSSSNAAIATITSSGNIHIVGVGTVTITASQSGNSGYTAATSVTQTLTVIPAALTITADNKTKVYGAANPPLTVTFSGFVNGETSAILTSQPTITTVAANLPVNIYQITPSGASAANYYISYVIGQLTVTPAPLTITADNQTKTSGQANPTLTYTYSGFVNGDAATSMSNFPILQTTATTSSPAGAYPITAVGAVNPNYNISYIPGTLTVLAAQTITFAQVTKTYGDADFALNATASSGLSVSYTASNPAVATVSSTGTVHIISAGTTIVTVSQSGNASYGAAPAVTQTLTINPAPLTIASDSKTKAYGTANPALTYTYSGFVNGETSAVLSAQPVIATTATTSANAGTYPITTTGAATANYVITNVTGTLTITPVPLTITADNLTRPYGQPNPPLSYTYAGFVNGDGQANMSSQPTLQTTATTTSPAGNYPITMAGAINTNYTISYVPGTLTVLLAQTITAFAAPPTQVYGAADFTLTATASSGLPVGFTGSNNAIATVSSTGVVHIVGIGTITVTASQSGNNNYAAAIPVTQTLTIIPATLTIIANNQGRIYNTSNPTLTVSYNGFVNNETSAVLTTQPNIATTATRISGAGTYPITASGASAVNYTINYTSGILTINKAPQTITFNPIPNQTQGDPDVTLIISTTSGLTPTVTSSDPTIASVTGLTVKLLSIGTVTLTATQAGDANYLPAIATFQTLTIKKPLPDLVLIHPLVTPNGDGINDILMIDGINNYPDNKLTLVSRNGVKIYESSGYNNSTVCFAGYSNITNSLQPQGTYFYSLQFTAGGQIQKRVGFIVLKY